MRYLRAIQSRYNRDTIAIYRVLRLLRRILFANLTNTCNQARSTQDFKTRKSPSSRAPEQHGHGKQPAIRRFWHT